MLRSHLRFVAHAVAQQRRACTDPEAADEAIAALWDALGLTKAERDVVGTYLHFPATTTA